MTNPSSAPASSPSDGAGEPVGDARSLSSDASSTGGSFTENTMDNQHNYGSGVDALRTELSAFREACERAAAQPIDDESAPLVRDLLDREVKLRKALENAKAEEKRPHLDANKAIEETYKPMILGLATLVKPLKAALTAHVQEIQRKQREEAERARREAEEAARKAAEEAAKAANPFAEADAASDREAAAAAAREAERKANERANVAGYESSRAVGLRTYWLTRVVDPKALVAHFADHPDVIGAAEKLAAAQVRAAKGQITIPGVTVEKEERVA